MIIIEHENGWQPLRKDKPLLTPKGRPLIVPTKALAQGIADEWVPIKTLPRRDQIPLMQFANTALDHVAVAPDAAVAGFLSHAESDVLCFRAASPQALQDRQTAAWQPLLDWLKETHGAELFVFTGLVHMKQDADALKILRAKATALDPFRLLALAQAAGLFGSATLALAFLEGRLDGPEALRLSMLEELIQSEEWGEPEEMKIRRADLVRELQELSTFLALLA